MDISGVRKSKHGLHRGFGRPTTLGISDVRNYRCIRWASEKFFLYWHFLCNKFFKVYPASSINFAEKSPANALHDLIRKLLPSKKIFYSNIFLSHKKLGGPDTPVRKTWIMYVCPKTVSCVFVLSLSKIRRPALTKSSLKFFQLLPKRILQ